MLAHRQSQIVTLGSVCWIKARKRRPRSLSRLNLEAAAVYGVICSTSGESSCAKRDFDLLDSLHQVVLMLLSLVRASYANFFVLLGYLRLPIRSLNLTDRETWDHLNSCSGLWLRHLFTNGSRALYFRQNWYFGALQANLCILSSSWPTRLSFIPIDCRSSESSYDISRYSPFMLV